MAGAIAGAAVGVATVYLFFTDRGRVFRDRLEPTLDDLRHEFGRLQRAFEKVGSIASDGLRAVEFHDARDQRQMRFPNDGTSH